MDSSSRNSTPVPAAASLFAQRGGAKRTESPATTGRPAKSEGSLIDAITVSHGRPIVSAIARMADVFPVPGAPHSKTGTRAATAIPSASAAGFPACGSLIPTVCRLMACCQCLRVIFVPSSAPSHILRITPWAATSNTCMVRPCSLASTNALVSMTRMPAAMASS